MAGIFNHYKLHAKAYAQQWLFINPRPCDCLDHPAGGASTKAARHDNTLDATEIMPGFVILDCGVLVGLVLEMRGVNQYDFDFLVAVHGCVFDRLGNTEIDIFVRGVFSHKGDGDCVGDSILTSNKIDPVIPHALALFYTAGWCSIKWKFEILADDGEEILFLEEKRYMICS